jgi:membrane-bound serine protease (ClpP class)
MAYGLLRSLLIVFFGLFLTQSSLAQTAPLPQKWLELKLGVISSASTDILKSAFTEIAEKKLDGLLIVLDTPGGSLEATRSMVQDIMSASVPVIVWVGPDGAHAGSAGTFITLAAHVASMAPGTNIGAAHPITAAGSNIDDASDLKTKVENDSIAFMESIADARGRNRSMAASFVANSLSVTAQEALSNKVIDLVAPDLKNLMDTVDGREVKVGPQLQTLRTKDAERVAFKKSARHELLEILSNPNLFYLLFIIGLLGLALEFTHPGAIAPGVVGAIALILALIASSMLPVNYGAMMLIMASVIFMVAEIFVPSFGTLGIGGLIGFVTGSVLLIDDKAQPGSGISYWLIIPMSFLILAAVSFISWLIVRNQHSKIRTGVDTLLGTEVEAVEFFINGHGRVRSSGEYWNAIEVDHKPVHPGDLLQVEAVNGLELKIRLLNPIGKE